MSFNYNLWHIKSLFFSFHSLTYVIDFFLVFLFVCSMNLNFLLFFSITNHLQKNPNKGSGTYTFRPVGSQLGVGICGS